MICAELQAKELITDSKPNRSSDIGKKGSLDVYVILDISMKLLLGRYECDLFISNVLSLLLQGIPLSPM